MRGGMMRCWLWLGVGLVGCGDGLPQAVCTEGTAWSDGQTAFRAASAEWGLQDLGATGLRLSAVDLDGDGWTDLVVRGVGNVGDDYAADARTTWVLRNTGTKQFEDVTVESGLFAPRKGATDRGRPGEVAAFADVDNDGDIDAFLTFSDPPNASPADETAEIMLNRGDGTFELGPKPNDVRVKESDAPCGASFTDVDRDGLVDLWVPRNGEQDRLYRGMGEGNFNDMTVARGLTTQPWGDVDTINAGQAHSVGWSAAACDLNGDGDPELLTASYGRAPNHLWQAVRDAEGSTEFLNRSVASGYAFDDRVDWSDNESARCWCSLHPDDEDCAGVPAPSIACSQDSDAFRWSHAYDREDYRLGGNSGTTVCSDVDNDGHLDLLTSEIVHWDVGTSSDPSELLFNSGESDVRFDRPGNESTGLVREHEPGWNDGDMTAAVFDFDNDAWPDVYIGSSDYSGTRGLLYRQSESRIFDSVPKKVGIDHTRSHGVAVADFDRDGDLDVVVGHSTSRCDEDCYDSPHIRFWENVLGEQGNWLQIDLEGVSANRSAVGARVTVTANGVTQTQEVGGGHGHYGIQHDLALHFGLGTSCEAEVTIRWPDAQLGEDTATLPAGHRFAWRQGELPAVTLPLEVGP